MMPVHNQNYLYNIKEASKRLIACWLVKSLSTYDRLLNNDYKLERDLTVVVIDPKLREYTSLENMRKLFFEEQKDYRVVIAGAAYCIAALRCRKNGR
ncbi:hypothetical protein FACS1894184_16040 [Clostridia bacterium]|nr:hypothetical protein FACS1894184_16040 [Clostridia bacterium]